MILHRLQCAAAALLLLAGGCATKPVTQGGVRVYPDGDTVRVEINGDLFTEYHYKDVPKPFLYPLIGPGGAPMTRNFPMRVVAGEEQDHPHHRSLWFGHEPVNGHNFWSETKGHGRIVHERFMRVKSGRAGIIGTRNRWVAADGSVVCTDERTITFLDTTEGRWVDFEITIHASHGDVTFGDSKEGSLALRVAESMKLKKPGQGRIVNSEGHRDGEAWGKRARWCDYSGPVDGGTGGIAVFDHPGNPRHPTWWHVRDYGLFAANPFGRHDFEKLADKTAGNLVIPSGRSVTFRYRIFLHDGDSQQAGVAERHREYVESVLTKTPRTSRLDIGP